SWGAFDRTCDCVQHGRNALRWLCPIHRYLVGREDRFAYRTSLLCDVRCSNWTSRSVVFTRARSIAKVVAVSPSGMLHTPLVEQSSDGALNLLNCRTHLVSP